MNKATLTQNLIDDLNQSGGMRPCDLVRRYSVGSSFTDKDVRDALYSIDGLEEMDVGDEDCFKPFVFIRSGSSSSV